jgi:hypothetical protein
MRTRPAQPSRRASFLLAGALALFPLAACTDDDGGDIQATAEATDTAATPTEDTTAAEDTEGTDAGDESTDTGTGGDVDCEGTSCSVTLTGDGAEADILGTSVVLGGVDNGQATFRIGDEEITCGQGDEVSAGPLTLECSSVEDGQVTMTASLG